MKNFINKIKANKGDETVNYPMLIIIGILLVAVIMGVIVPAVRTSITSSGSYITEQTACAQQGKVYNSTTKACE